LQSTPYWLSWVLSNSGAEDKHEVTNAEFAKFAEVTEYVTTAERKPDWEELKIKKAASARHAEAGRQCSCSWIVFTPTSGPVPLDDLSVWWRGVPGADWRHPE
jgi:sulfatase modifying factor 1